MQNSVVQVAQTIQRPSLAEAMRHSASSIAVVTAGVGREITGCTVSTAASFSVDPETMLVSINRRSSTYRAIREHKHFCVNMLAADQVDVAERFAGRLGTSGPDRYEGSEWFRLDTGALALHGALASIDCWLDEVLERHSHAIVLGTVSAIVVDAALPLTYRLGEYRSFERPGR